MYIIKRILRRLKANGEIITANKPIQAVRRRYIYNTNILNIYMEIYIYIFILQAQAMRCQTSQSKCCTNNKSYPPIKNKMRYVPAFSSIVIAKKYLYNLFVYIYVWALQFLYTYAETAIFKGKKAPLVNTYIIKYN